MISISPEEMSAIDANCAGVGLLPLQLMENAGAALAREILAFQKGAKKIAIVAGRGNNGGDALVAARHLGSLDVVVFLLGRSRDISTDEARRNWQILDRLGFDIREVRDPEELKALSKNDIVVDAILGTGVRGSVRGLEGAAIEAINGCGRPVISVDVPSGMGTDRVVRPDLTVTFHLPKSGMTGEIRAHPIGIPPQAEFLAGPGDLALIGSRGKDSHKGESGRILVIGGGAYSGAPALTALAALRSGTDIVTVAAPRSVSGTIAGFSPNLIVRALSGDRLCHEDLDLLKDLISAHDVVVMGMGLGRAPETKEALEKIIPLCKRAVIDADALLPDLPLRGIVTPHAGEFRRISGLDLPEDGGLRRETVRRFAAEGDVVVLLKGRLDLISDGTVVRGNATGNAGMTVGGTGDVLAGISAAFYARAPPLRAAVAAAFVNGRAGDLVYAEKDYGMVATDLLEKIPIAMRS